ncbi:MAG: hypothetical protein ACM3XM_06670 [Mycobacterium leprae]
MSEPMRTAVEIAFNIAYLITIWGLVVDMYGRRRSVRFAERPVALHFRRAFALLAAGDTGHVGFRVVAFLLGGLEANAWLVGLGTLATAVTITLFYVWLLVIWQERNMTSYGWVGAGLLLTAAIRLVILTFPQNQWGLVVPPHTWSLYRNLPLVVQGVGVMLLILSSAARRRDSLFLWLGVLIGLSHAFYLPVILYVQQVPWVGMLMIPKTLAYLGMAAIVYQRMYVRAAPPAWRG